MVVPSTKSVVPATKVVVSSTKFVVSSTRCVVLSTKQWSFPHQNFVVPSTKGFFAQHLFSSTKMVVPRTKFVVPSTVVEGTTDHFWEKYRVGCRVDTRGEQENSVPCSHRGPHFENITVDRHFECHRKKCYARLLIITGFFLHWFWQYLLT